MRRCRSSTTTERPRPASTAAHASPTAPAPTMATSTSCASGIELQRDQRDVVDELRPLHLGDGRQDALADELGIVLRVLDDAEQELHAHPVRRPVERLDEPVGHE